MARTGDAFRGHVAPTPGKPQNASNFWVWGLGLGFRVSGLGFMVLFFFFLFRVSGLGFRVQGLGFRVYGMHGSGPHLWPCLPLGILSSSKIGPGRLVSGLGFRVSGFFGFPTWRFMVLINPL